MKSGALGDDVADCFKNADRSTKAQLVNSVVAKTEDGTYQIVTDNKQFRYNDSQAIDFQSSRPVLISVPDFGLRG